MSAALSWDLHWYVNVLKLQGCVPDLFTWNLGCCGYHVLFSSDYIACSNLWISVLIYISNVFNGQGQKLCLCPCSKRCWHSPSPGALPDLCLFYKEATEIVLFIAGSKFGYYACFFHGQHGQDKCVCSLLMCTNGWIQFACMLSYRSSAEPWVLAEQPYWETCCLQLGFCKKEVAEQYQGSEIQFHSFSMCILY